MSEAPQKPLNLTLFNVKYSPNLGDGLLSEQLEHALIECGSDPLTTGSADLSARTTYAPGDPGRSKVLAGLSVLPGPARRAVVRLPLERAMRSRWKPHYEAALEGADAAIVGGGNLFTDMDLNFPLKVSTALTCAAARAIPTAIFGVGVGAEWSRPGLAMMRSALQAARPVDISVRDTASAERFNTLFAEAAGRRARVVRDPGLLVSRYVPRPDAPAPDAPKTVGLCITSAVAIRYHSDMSVGDEALATWYITVARALAEAGHQIAAFTNGSPEDEAFAARLAERLSSTVPGRVERRRAPDPTALATLIASFDALAAHRMHALIAAVSYGVPVMALSWDSKVASFMGSIDRPHRLAVAEPGTEPTVAADINAMLTQRDDAGPAASTLVADAFGHVGELYRALQSARPGVRAAA